VGCEHLEAAGRGLLGEGFDLFLLQSLVSPPSWVSCKDLEGGALKFCGSVNSSVHGSSDGDVRSEERGVTVALQG